MNQKICSKWKKTLKPDQVVGAQGDNCLPLFPIKTKGLTFTCHTLILAVFTTSGPTDCK